MARYIWTLIAGFVLGIFTIFQIVLRFKPLRKIAVDATVKAMVDFIHGPEPIRRYPVYPRGYRPFRNYSEMVTNRTVSLMVDTHDETIKILAAMHDLVDEQGHFTMADLKTACGREVNTFQDERYGWTSVDDVLFFSKDIEGKPGYLLTTKRLAEAI